MKVTLQVNGRKMTFLEQELSSIVEKHFSSSKTTQQTTTAKVAQEPTEDVWFEVKPREIDQKLFEKERYNNRQEETRKLILEAFAIMKDYPGEYGINFKTMMPQKTWRWQTVEGLKERARDLGDHNANWIEQALEWAQRIANGESWEAICNDKDKANWYRLVIWKTGHGRIVGGSLYLSDNAPASYVSDNFYDDNDYLYLTVPLVVLYE